MVVKPSHQLGKWLISNDWMNLLIRMIAYPQVCAKITLMTHPVALPPPLHLPLEWHGLLRSWQFPPNLCNILPVVKIWSASRWLLIGVVTPCVSWPPSFRWPSISLSASACIFFLACHDFLCIGVVYLLECHTLYFNRFFLLLLLKSDKQGDDVNSPLRNDLTRVLGNVNKLSECLMNDTVTWELNGFLTQTLSRFILIWLRHEVTQIHY